VVLLRKRFPQKPNLQTAAVLSVKNGKSMNKHVSKSIIFFLISIASLSLAAKEGAPCPDGKDQGELMCFNGTLQDPCNTGSGLGSAICTERSLKIADTELNRLYKIVLAKVEPDGEERKPRTAFIKMQRTWILWRDSICNYEQQANSGSGSWQATARNNCLIRITELRSKSFSNHLACNPDGTDFSCEFEYQ
jgi:uncharacterized protein YecT (DUF1311 family)